MQHSFRSEPTAVTAHDITKGTRSAATAGSSAATAGTGQPFVPSGCTGLLTAGSGVQQTLDSSRELHCHVLSMNNTINTSRSNKKHLKLCAVRPVHDCYENSSTLCGASYAQGRQRAGSELCCMRSSLNGRL
jgi:hypothetical protein